MWIINDFPVYEIVSGRSTHEKLDFSYCMEKNRAYTLMNDDIFFFITIEGSCQVIIDTKTKKKNRNDFLKGKAKREVASSILSSEEFYDVVSQYEDIVFDFLFCK
jgi:predicted peroxiredoxin